jgi:hypothetical protein
MNRPLRQPRPDQSDDISPTESARYTRDLLTQLKSIAEDQGQSALAHLLALASLEAEALAKH